MSDRASSTDTLWREARAAEQSGDRGFVVTKLAEILDADPGSARARLKLGLSLRDAALEKRDPALVAFVGTALRSLAVSLSRTGELSIALAVARAALDLEPAAPAVLGVLDAIERRISGAALPGEDAATDRVAALPVGEIPDVLRRAAALALSISSPAGEVAPVPVPLLYGLPHELFRSTVEKMQLIRVGPGVRIIEQGAAPGSVYLLLDGEVEVSKSTGDRREVLGKLGPGSTFGEMALVSARPRTATVTSLVPIDALELSAEAINQLVENDPEVKIELRRAAAENVMLSVFNYSPLFAPLDWKTRVELLRGMTLHLLDPGDRVIDQGNPPTGLYLIATGMVRIGRVREDGEVVPVKELAPGDVMGEMALVAGELTTARAEAVEPTLVFHLDQIQFEQFTERYPQALQYLWNLAARRQRELDGTAEGSRTDSWFVV